MSDNISKLLGALLGSAIIITGCTDPESVKHYAEIEGWESYEITGYKWAACSDSEIFHTGFKAIKNKKSFTGTVCKGLFFRGSTLRLD